MILTVVPNPALDKTVILAGFETGRTFRANQILTLAGGKGFNFARALPVFGERGLVVTPLGGNLGQHLLELAGQDRLDCDYQPIKAELRTCLTIIDPAAANRLTEIYENGAALEPADWQKLVERAANHFREATFMAVCGSFPPGVPANGLYELVKRAKAAGLPVLLDTYGPQLTGVLELEPALLKINQHEAGAALGREITGPAQAFEAAAELQKRGAQQVVITLGILGAVGLTRQLETFGWRSPAVAAVSPVGSGDCLFAGLAARLGQGKSLPEATRWGVAAGAANTLQVGAGRFAESDLERLYSLVQPLTPDRA
jgi:1-phosphofructokinase family hexose kinase